MEPTTHQSGFSKRLAVNLTYMLVAEIMGLGLLGLSGFSGLSGLFRLFRWSGSTKQTRQPDRPNEQEMRGEGSWT